jgi:parallel beta-helix repeat protein
MDGKGVTLNRRDLIIGSPILLLQPVISRSLTHAYITQYLAVPGSSPYLRGGQSHVNPPAQPAQSVRSFGATGDGVTDDSSSIQKCIDQSRSVSFPKGRYLLNTPLYVPSGTSLTGAEGAVLLWKTSSLPQAIRIEGGSQSDPAAFSKNVAISGISFEHPLGSDGRPGREAITATNVRGLTVTDCKFSGSGGVLLTHQLKQRANVEWQKRSGGDPAAVAGFSAQELDDLNEDFTFTGNHVDGLGYWVQGLRVEYATRGVIANNIVRYGSISWWGGGARIDQGGDWKYPRRVRDVKIYGNTVSMGQGGIYGNNGDHIDIHDNHVESILDTGIDLEGCSNCTVTHNTVKNCGNFCYSIFYGSINNLFTGNLGVQTPEAKDLYLKLGAPKMGPQTGIALFAWRTGGFSGPSGVDTIIKQNVFRFEGNAGLGEISPGPFSSLVFEGNQLSNVVMDLRGFPLGSMSIQGNTFAFNRVPQAGPLVGVKMRTRTSLQVKKNTVNISDGSGHYQGVLIEVGPENTIAVEDNAINSSSSSIFDIGIQSSANANGSVVSCSRNKIRGSIAALSPTNGLRLSGSDRVAQLSR